LESRKKKLIYIVNADWAFISHRLPLALYTMSIGYDVTIVAIEERNLGSQIRNYGFKFIPLPTTRSSTNIFKEINVIFFLVKLFKREKPDIVHNVTLKPVAYVSIVARFFRRIKVINAITGFGTIFIDKKANRLNHFLLMRLFNFGFRNSNLRFILQNIDDYGFVSNLGNIERNNLFLIPGSGVNTNEFKYSNEPNSDRIKFLLPARMLWDKGVGEFEIAARSLFLKYKEKAEFILAGDIDIENKTAVPIKLLKKWTNLGHVKWIGHQTNIAELISESHVVVLPSYQEGLPKSLIEACSVGRAIITTDVPGCRDVVENNLNGLLVKLKDSKSLEEAMEFLINHPEIRKKMGVEGRRKAESTFDISLIVKQTVEVYQSYK
jgi:glycosyltransferase involved in cell wall biosynthesis